MKKLGLLALLALPTFVSTTNVSTSNAAPAKKKAGPQVKWHSTYASALAESKKTGKPLFVDFYTTWCGPCKYLDSVVYKDAKFIAESKGWVLAKIDAEKNKTNTALANKFKVQGYPTLVYIKPNGKEVGRSVGAYPAPLLVTEMRKAMKKPVGGKSI